MPNFATFRTRRNSAPALVYFDATDTMADRAGRTGRRRPFSALMKKLANLKATSSGDGGRHASKRNEMKKRQMLNNNPYQQSGRAGVVSMSQHSQPSII